MKKILFLIFGLISFSASADMEKMWGQRDGLYTTTAYCVFESKYKIEGFIFLYIKFYQSDQFEVVPYGSVCKRKPSERQ